MKRTLLLAGLLAAYAWTALNGLVFQALQRDRFDPFLPLARRVEQLVEERRFDAALPLALDLEKSYPDEPLVAYWFARIRGGLGDRAAEAAAWERYIAIASTPSEACPAIADAYAAAGNGAAALDAYARCAAFDPGDADALVDLGDAQLRAGRSGEALAAFTRAAAIDPDNPLIRRRLQGVPVER